MCELGSGELTVDWVHQTMRAHVLCSCGCERMKISMEYHQRDKKTEISFAPDYKPQFGPLEQIRAHAPHLLN